MENLMCVIDTSANIMFNSFYKHIWVFGVSWMASFLMWDIDLSLIQLDYGQEVLRPERNIYLLLNLTG